jgi:multiple sugar transport system permease protein
MNEVRKTMTLERPLPREPWVTRRGVPLALQAAQYAVLIVLALIMLVPFVWTVSTSFKEQSGLATATPEFIPDPASLDAYRTLSDRMDIPRLIFNSFFVTVVGTAGQVIFAAMAAYAFSRMVWRGRDTVFLLYLATLMIPVQVIIIPQFILIRHLGWVNSYQGLIIPSLFNAFGVFLLRQSFLTLPRDLEEAAFIDGANRFTVFWRVVLPLSKPALATLTVFNFMALWNAYLWPLFVARKDEVMTLPVALANLAGSSRYQGSVEWNVVMAGAVITILPILIAYLFAQKWFVRGVTFSGIKG